jgi:phosphatidylserine decarboxylase
VNNFDNYNAFFARRLKPERRDYLCYLDDAEKCKQQGEDLVKEGKRKNLTFNEQLPIIISPADSRIMLIQKLEESRFWIKGEQFKLESLVSLKKEHYRYYQGGRMLISRLSPQDYHRFHFPIDGRVTEFKHYPGAYYSVNPIAIGHEHTPVFHSNKRMHAMIRSKFFGCVLYVSVAATNVGSIGHTSYVGQEVIRGMEHGFMQFGGSTVLIIFPKNVAEFDPLIKDASSVPIETIVQVGAKLGEWTGKYPPGGSSPCD